MEERDEDANIIPIRGFSVHFPKGRKPFAPQLALMSKMLTGVQKGENCLLESPTGTGKTLALLCAALAWQRQQKDLAAAMESDCESEAEDIPVTSGRGGEEEEPPRRFKDFRYVDPGMPKMKPPVELAYEDSVGSPRAGGRAGGGGKLAYLGNHDDDDDDDDFESPKKKRQKKPKIRAHKEEEGIRSVEMGEEVGIATGSASSPVASETPVGSRSGGRTAAETSPDLNADCGAHAGGKSATSRKPLAEVATPNAKAKDRQRKPKKMKKRVPRVFFCSRTHSQLNQVVAELRTCRGAFESTSAVGVGEDGKPFSMALLASRKSTCINKKACNDPRGVDDACKRLLKDKACSYQRRSKWGTTKMPPVWDVEEAVQLGKENQTCPYYNARDSLTTADLVLCPYNYLVDPGVREVMGINLKDAVVIFDEAHNLEDSAREAASAKISLRALANTASEMERLGANSPSLGLSYGMLRDMIVGVQDFLEETDGRLNLGGYEKAHKVFKGAEALGLMQSRAGVTPESLVDLKEALALVLSEGANADPLPGDEQGEFELSANRYGADVLSSGAVHVTASLVKVLGFLLTESMENVQHYKMVVLRERGPWQPASTRGRRGRRRDSGGRGGGYGGGGSIGAMETYLCFWCQSAGVCFSEIDSQVHSIILTSGTLSPLDSFAGELGIDFPHRLEAPHVINVAKQCLVTSVGFFDGVSLDARYANQHDLKYQDALGNALLQYARVVPGGMLAFFPSYGLMDKMHERWEDTGLLAELEAVKNVHVEPRGQGKIEGVLAEYYGDIEDARDWNEIDPGNHRTGALLLAVARGKVSEGIDFSDDAARMCVIIGIPYPSSKDLQVTLKKEYQNQRRIKTPSLVGGAAWYNLQAFRAVNQAVGRCIRHQNDFGAIVLCDPRYSSQSGATANLSKWVRSSVKQCRTVEASLSHVDNFFQQHGHRPQRNGEGCTPVAVQRPVGSLPGSENIAAGHSSGGGGCGDCSGGGSGGGSGGCSGGHSSRTDDRENQAKDGRDGVQTEEGASRGPADPGAGQRTITQMFSNSSADRTEERRSPIGGTTIMRQRSATLIQGTNGRTALQLLSQSRAPTRAASLPNAKPISPQTPARNPDPFTRNPDPVARSPDSVARSPDPVSKGRDGTFWCRSAQCTGGALISEPAGRCNLGEQTCPPPRPRRITPPVNCHLYRTAPPTQSVAGGITTSTSPSGTNPDCGAAAPVLLEAPRGWTLGDHVSEGQGRWMSDDGMVYAPLFCSCTGCCSVYVGEKAIGAGLGGEDLIGRSWFFTALVDANSVGEVGSPRELTLPARLAVVDQPPSP